MPEREGNHNSNNDGNMELGQNARDRFRIGVLLAVNYRYVMYLVMP